MMIVDPYRFAPGGGGGSDPDFANVVFLSGFEGADGGTTFTDESSYARSLTTIGDAQIDTAQFKYGASSALFDGTGDRISAAHDSLLSFAGLEFTIELWARFVDNNVSRGLLSKSAAAAANSAWRLDRDSSNRLLFVYHYGTSNANPPPLAIPADSNWHHLVAERVGDNVAVAVDGVFGTINSMASSTINAGTDAMFIGARQQGGTTVTQMNGHLDEVRITRGSNRYNLTNFTPPTAAFPRS